MTTTPSLSLRVIVALLAAIGLAGVLPVSLAELSSGAACPHRRRHRSRPGDEAGRLGEGQCEGDGLASAFGAGAEAAADVGEQTVRERVTERTAGQAIGRLRPTIEGARQGDLLVHAPVVEGEVTLAALAPRATIVRAASVAPIGRDRAGGDREQREERD